LASSLSEYAFYGDTVMAQRFGIWQFVSQKP